METLKTGTRFAEALGDLRCLWATNRGALDITRNSIKSLLNMAVAPDLKDVIHIACVDAETISYFARELPFATLIDLRENEGWRAFVRTAVEGDYNNYGSPEFRDISFARYFALMHMMEERDAPILYTDGDISYRKDPRPFLKAAANKPGAGVLIQSDLPCRPTTRHDPSGRVILAEGDKPNHCTGLSCWSTAARTRELATKLIEARDPTNPDSHDQYVMNRLPAEDLADLERLPELVFLNGSYLFDYDGEYKFPLNVIDNRVVGACAVHANWMIGMDKKTAGLRRLGLFRF